MGYAAKIILDSVGPNGARLTTFELTYPRIIHSELMTHRMLSRNAASSRAIPAEKMRRMIEVDPAMPVWWGKNQSGMQAREELEGQDLDDAKYAWGCALSEMINSSDRLSKTGLHKQIVNRITEPWMFITVLVSATELGNLFALRVHPDAQPEFEKFARMAKVLYDASTPQKLGVGEWHMPLVTGVDETELRKEGFAEPDLLNISVGRCARASYLTHDGKRDPKADIALTDKIQTSGHMSPFEHPAMALTQEAWENHSDSMMKEWVRHRIPIGNFWGWLQMRKALRNEHDFSLIVKSARQP